MITIKTSKSQLQVVPQFGGLLADLQLFNGQRMVAILDSYQMIEDVEAKAYYKSHFLLPFPNRMKDGKYDFDGKSYQFPINDTNNQHNLHGFLETLPMTIIEEKTSDTESIISLQAIFEGLEYYPFPFDFFVKYTLTNSELTIQTKIKNTGSTKMPIGFGWHPYFKLDTELIDNLKMQLPDCELIKVDNRMMPTSEQTAFTTFFDLSTIGNTSLDNCFILNKPTEIAEIILASDTTTLKFWQETTAFPYFQIYTPDSRKSIAIEPMTCNVDAFNNLNGLWILESDEMRTMEFGVSLF